MKAVSRIATTHKPTSDKKPTGASRRPDGVICVPLAPTANRPPKPQLLRRQRRHWHRYLALEPALSSPKGAAYRHDPEIDWQRADSIKFVFRGASISSANCLNEAIHGTVTDKTTREKNFTKSARNSEGVTVETGRDGLMFLVRLSRIAPPSGWLARPATPTSPDELAVPL
jgi:hypothetical protein